MTDTSYTVYIYFDCEHAEDSAASAGNFQSSHDRVQKNGARGSQ